MTEYEECTQGKSIVQLVLDYKYQVTTLGYEPMDSYPDYLRELINKRLLKKEFKWD